METVTVAWPAVSPLTSPSALTLATLGVLESQLRLG
jgi:hypothetical protein